MNHLSRDDRMLLASARRDARAAEHTRRFGRADHIRGEVFLARYPGHCDRCEKPIKRGACIRSHVDYDGWVHDNCQPAHRRPNCRNPAVSPATPNATGPTKPDVCPACWTVHAGDCW